MMHLCVKSLNMDFRLFIYLVFFLFPVLFPPRVFEVGKCLCQAVQGFALRHVYGFSFGAVAVLPGGDNKELAAGALFQPCAGRVVAFAEAVVGEKDCGKAAAQGFVHDLMLA